MGETTVRLCLSAPTPTSCPPNCSCHHILPSRGQGAPVGVHGPETALAPFAVPRSGPRHPGSQCRVLLCHTDLDKFLADSATLYPNSGLKWRCKTPDSTPVLVYRGYRCRNEVFSSLHNSDSQGCANTFAKRVPRQLCIPAGTQELVRNTLGTKQT